MDRTLPQSVKTTLWSYNTDKIDLELHKTIIVSQVLNFGDQEATTWLFDYYGKPLVKAIAETIPLGQWDKKSLSLWSQYLGIDPQPRSKRILHG
jgi:hypothetical protein